MLLSNLKLKQSDYTDLQMNKSPNFLVIGANKAGTSSLHQYLDQHPDIFMSPVKEPMYFRYGFSDEALDLEEKNLVRRLFRTEPEYLQLFEGAKNEKMRGESSTTYLANSSCAKHIHSFNPEMKIIAILRNPIERAYSNYQMYIRKGLENLSFQKAVENERNGLKEKCPQGKKYLKLGKYAQSLSSYFDLFGREQVKVFLYEDMKAQKELLVEIFQFLEVREDVNIDTSIMHNSFPTFSYNRFVRALQRQLPSGLVGHLLSNVLTSKLDEVTFNSLKEYYDEENRTLASLIGRDLSHWSRYQD
jgi:hypothetical protein